MERSVGAASPALTNARIAAVLLTNLALTVLTALGVGPSVSKLEDLFGLVGWVGRAPFYLLPLYLGPIVLWVRPAIRTGILLGLAVGAPLALWAVATRCPPVVPAAYLVSGVVQGALLSWMARRKGGRERP